MQSVVFFNNKGGVGKTTLCCNVASCVGAGHGKNVLLIDCDPQCNSTRLILGDERCEDLYYDGKEGFQSDTILSVLRPILDGESSINTKVTPVDSKHNRFDIDLLPGHPELAMLEDALSDAWGSLGAGKVEGLRRTHWATYLLRAFTNYDLIIFDVGPSLGALNRSVLVASESFITPMGCDIFSIVGVRNIAKWLKNWLRTYDVGVDLCQKERTGVLEEYKVPITLQIKQGFAGYTVQQYITKSKEGLRRPTKAYESIMSLIPKEIHDNLLPFSCKELGEGKSRLGDVPHLYSLVPLAQVSNAPVHRLKSADGLVGAQYGQQEAYTTLIEGVADRLLVNLGQKVCSR